MPQEQIFGILIAVIMGLGWGSFATMATYRIPRGKPWIGDQPRCFLCKAELSIIDYFSILSYFYLHGKCRHCGGKYEENISYFITELAITIIFVMLYLKYNFYDLFVLLTGATVAVVILATVDAEHKKIPSKILISTLIIGIIYRMFMDHGNFYGVLYGGVLGAVVGLAVRHAYFILKGEAKTGADYTQWQHEDRFIGPGFDYVKMLSIVGVYLNIEHFLAYVTTTGLILLIWRLIAKNSLRIGSVMSCVMLLFICYPEIPGFIYANAQNLLPH